MRRVGPVEVHREATVKFKMYQISHMEKIVWSYYQKMAGVSLMTVHLDENQMLNKDLKGNVRESI